MRFHIDHGDRSYVAGWIIPDDAATPPAVRVTLGGVEAARIQADGFDPNILANGWHPTGRCRFGVSGAEVPGFGSAPLRVYDADTNILLYADDPDRAHCPARAFVLAPGIRPDGGLDKTLVPAFRYAYTDVHGMPRETLETLVGGSWIGPSCLMAGRLCMPAWEDALSRSGFVTATLLPDPFVEMAERVLRLGSIGRNRPAWALGDLAPGAARFADLDVRRAPDLKAALRFADEPTYRFLSNPVTRLLGIDLEGDDLRPAHSINAVEVLARIGIVGHAAHAEGFAAALGERLGMAGPVPVPPAPSDEALELAARLSAMKVARAFGSFDVAIDEIVRSTFARAWEGAPGLRRA